MWHHKLKSEFCERRCLPVQSQISSYLDTSPTLQARDDKFILYSNSLPLPCWGKGQCYSRLCHSHFFEVNKKCFKKCFKKAAPYFKHETVWRHKEVVHVSPRPIFLAFYWMLLTHPWRSVNELRPRQQFCKLSFLDSGLWPRLSLILPYICYISLHEWVCPCWYMYI